VNLIVAQERGEISRAGMVGVLDPGGVAYINAGDAWNKHIKPFSAAIAFTLDSAEIDPHPRRV